MADQSCLSGFLTRLFVTLTILGSTAGWGRAALQADIETSRGVVVVELAYDTRPLAVANFLGLATGERSWIDPVTGAIRDEPFYDGLVFDRVIDEQGDRRAVCGGGVDTEPEQVGYCFPDEFPGSPGHEPYVIAMENTGPNTNGASWYLTGDAALPDRDGRWVVFGTVADDASRQTVDAIIAAGAGATSVTGIEIRRTDDLSESFDESAVALPDVRSAAGRLEASPGAPVTFLRASPQSPSTVFLANRSSEMIDWSPWFRRFAGPFGMPGPAEYEFEGEAARRAFYHLAEVVYPEAAGVESMANRRLEIESPGTGTLVYRFDPTGLAGTYENILLPGEDPFLEGEFVLRDDIAAWFGPHSFQIMIEAEGLGGSPFNLIRGGIDAEQSTRLTGRHVTDLRSTPERLTFQDQGPLVLSRPAE